MLHRNRLAWLNSLYKQENCLNLGPYGQFDNRLRIELNWPNLL